MNVELTIVIKSAEATYRKKYIFNNPVILDSSSQEIRNLIKQTLDDFKQKPDDCKVSIRATMEA